MTSGPAISRNPFAILSILLVLSLTACSLPTSPARQAAQQNQAAATQAAFAVETEIARPTPTRTPPATATPPAPSATPPAASATPTAGGEVTALPGLALFRFSDLPEYVFQADASLWKLEAGGSTSSLVHKTISNCRVESVLGHGIGPPLRYFWQDLGRFRWEILDYGSTALIIPILGNGIEGSGGSYLNLQGYDRSACKTAQEKILTNLMSSRESAGQIPFALYASPTPRPAPEGFNCPNAPPARLRVGDWVSIITDGLLLRSEPRADQSTRISSYMRYAPVMIRVIAGPVCEKYVYWQVEVSTFGEGGTSKQGWFAEGDQQEYYLAPVK